MRYYEVWSGGISMIKNAFACFFNTAQSRFHWNDPDSVFWLVHEAQCPHRVRMPEAVITSNKADPMPFTHFQPEFSWYFPLDIFQEYFSWFSYYICILNYDIDAIFTSLWWVHQPKSFSYLASLQNIHII